MVVALASLGAGATLPAFARPSSTSFLVQSNASDLPLQKPDTPVATPLVLNEGFSLTKEMKGGETHEFQFSLQRGQFLNARIEQQGIDVEVHLLDSKGNEVTGMDSLNGDFGPEVIASVIAESGEYRLQVICSNPKAAAGHYELKIVALHAATATDSDHAAAEQSMGKGGLLLGANTAESRASALQNFQSALQFFQADGERDRQALALYSVAYAYANSSEFRKALSYLPQAMQIFQELHDANMEATTLSLLGGANDVLGNLSTATSYYEQDIAIARREHQATHEASALNDIGKIYHDLGDWQNSLKYFQQALPLLQTVGDRSGEGTCLTNIGRIYLNLGDFDDALHYLLQSLSVRRSLGDKAGQAHSLTNLGNVYRMQGKQDEAVHAYTEALALHKAVGNPRTEADTLDSAGAAYAEWGDLQKALEFHRRALELRRTTSDLRGEAVSLANLGHVEYLLKRLDAAVREGQQALEIYRKIGDKRGIVEALDLLAHAERDQGQLTQARAHIEEAISRIEDQRSQVASEDLRASYFALGHNSYLFYVDLLMQLDRQDSTRGYAQEALEVSERARARSLLELLGESHVSIHQGVDVALVNREQELGQRLDAKAERLTHSLGKQESTPELDELKAEIGDLERQYQEVRAAIRMSSPQFAAINQPQPATVQQIQQQILDADTLLLEYILGDSASHVWAVSQSGVHSYQLPKREVIEAVARDLYQLLSS